MYNYDDAINLLTRASTMSVGRFERKLSHLFKDKAFKMAIFRPEEDSVEVNTALKELYEACMHYKTLRAINDYFEETRGDGVDRTIAAFLSSVVNMTYQIVDTEYKKVADAYTSDKMSMRDADKAKEKLIKLQDEANRLLRNLKKVVKRSAKYLSNDTEVPKAFCAVALYSTPEPDILDSKQIGFFLRTLLDLLYSNVNVDSRSWDFDERRGAQWKKFFTEIFGKKRLPDVATLILLEGCSRVDRYENRAVHDCWDSLTTFALEALENSTDQIRDQMIELYMKRVNKMLANHNLDVRVDLLKIDDVKFERLVKSVSKVKDKLTEIIQATKEIANSNSTVKAESHSSAPVM